MYRRWFIHQAFTEATLEALHNLRSAAHFQWYHIPFIAFVIYVYFVEVERKNWNVVMAGLAFFSLECFLEICNALWLHFSGHSAIWTTPGNSAYIIMVGLTVEISMMFSVAGVVFANILPEDREMKILGIPNRWFFVIVNSLLCVFIEVILNFWGGPGVGVLLVELAKRLADHHHRLLSLHDLRLLDPRHGVDEEEGVYCRKRLRGGHRTSHCLHGDTQVDIEA